MSERHHVFNGLVRDSTSRFNHRTSTTVPVTPHLQTQSLPNQKLSSSTTTTCDFTIYDDPDTKVHYNVCVSKNLRQPASQPHLPSQLRNNSAGLQNVRNGLPARLLPSSNTHPTLHNSSSQQQQRNCGRIPPPPTPRTCSQQQLPQQQLPQQTSQRTPPPPPPMGEYLMLAGDATLDKKLKDTTISTNPLISTFNHNTLPDITSNKKDFRNFSLKFVGDYKHPSSDVQSAAAGCGSDVTTHYGATDQRTENCFKCDRMIDLCTCMVFVKSFNYILNNDSEDDDDEASANPCTCAGKRSKSCKRWLFMALLSLFCPCLCCYIPCQVCKRQAMRCSSHKRRRRKLKREAREEQRYIVQFIKKTRGEADEVAGVGGGNNCSGGKCIGKQPAPHRTSSDNSKSIDESLSHDERSAKLPNRTKNYRTCSESNSPLLL